MTNSVILLISCGKRKSDVTCLAKNMYNSCRFQKLKSIAESNSAEWYILSAKHGLLSPEKIIQPYDLCLADCTDEYKRKWAEGIIKKFSHYNKDTLFLVVANNDYSQHIVPLLISEGFKVAAPFLGKDEDVVSDYVENALHVADTVELYNQIYQLAEQTGGIRVFKDCTGKMYWPKRGVYFFVDFNERSLVSNNFPRIVRVGTHAVSSGSKTTLWHRLKTHKGTNEGGGNHRGSIFRLHVGNAIIKREKIECDTWGKGQNASKEIREKERVVEQLVSEYLGQLGVIVLDVDDLPSATSARAYVEKNAIALLSSNNSSFNFSTCDWLGGYSPRNEIKSSCLWNINYINSEYDSNFLKVFFKYADLTAHNYKLL